MRVFEHPILGPLTNDKKVTIVFDGKEYIACEGEAIAATLLAYGIKTIRYTESSGEPRGIYCGIGHCYECRVTVNGVRSVRACITPAVANMVIESQGAAVDGR